MEKSVLLDKLTNLPNNKQSKPKTSLSSGSTHILSTPQHSRKFFCHDTLSEPNTLKQIVIKRQAEGQELVDLLKATVPKKNANATTYRKEQKGPVHQKGVEDAFKQLSKAGITFTSRESKKKNIDLDAANPAFQGTFTYYGKAAKYDNRGDITKIRMRIRYYIEGQSDKETGQAFDVKRSSKTDQAGYVELKIKNPRSSEEGYVDKYRIIVPDPLIYKLINLDPNSDRFDHDINELRENILKLSIENKPLNKSDTVNAMIETIKALAIQDTGFIKPHLAITYARDGYSLKEDYPIDIYKKKGLLGRINPLSSNMKVEKRTKEIEYQLTVDRYISAHKPLLPTSENQPMPITEHFNPEQKTEVYRYPKEIRVMEFKQPKPMADFPEKKQSETHKTLSANLVGLLENKRAWGSPETQTGKYGTFRAHLNGAFTPPVLKKYN